MTASSRRLIAGRVQSCEASLEPCVRRTGRDIARGEPGRRRQGARGTASDQREPARRGFYAGLLNKLLEAQGLRRSEKISEARFRPTGVSEAAARAEAPVKRQACFAKLFNRLSLFHAPPVAPHRFAPVSRGQGRRRELKDDAKAGRIILNPQVAIMQMRHRRGKRQAKTRAGTRARVFKPHEPVEHARRDLPRECPDHDRRR